ncbi:MULTISPECIES: formyltransferase family protein [Fusobacterium]|uniref:formyltransferase family protein n=1 Tax=Fusobacterium TaxID=848 RepID=UPI001476FF6A|nr:MULTISPECIES: formyltransferase family protein [Fusobacterium]NME35816.1 hypothetical protein [Fusobacterium sp. FSA-380-WT-3A]
MKKICIAGKNNIAVEITDYIEKNIECELFVIPNSADDGVNKWQKSFLKFSLDRKLKIISLEEAYKIKDLIFISLEYDKIINPKKFNTTELFNIHFSLLPKYKGMYTSALPILNNEKETGVTFHKINTGIDTGDIIAQKVIKIDYEDTSRDLYLKYIKNGIILVKNIIWNIIEKKYVVQQQDYLESTYFSKKSIDYKNLKIDLNQTAINIHNQIRAFNFREYQLPEVYGSKIIATKITNQKSIKKSGEILFETDNEILISTIDYNIILYKDKAEELITACKIGDLISVKNICKNKEYLKIRTKEGWDPLIIATYNNHKDIVEYLISIGADIYTTNYNKTNLLMYAKEAFLNKNDIYLLELFLKLGLNIFEEDIFGKNLLDYCNEEIKEKINGDGVQK